MRPRSIRLGALLFIVGLVVGSLGCSRGEPPAPEGVDLAAAPLPPPAAIAVGVEVEVEAGAADAGPAAKASPVGVAAPAPAADAIDPGTLPHTRDKPEASSDALDARAAALWDAIVHDDPERAMPFFFPLTAYEQVKAVGSPAADWKRRLVTAYERDVHALHQRLGRDPSLAKLVRIDVPTGRARWMDPGEEYNKLGYWRVYGTRIFYEVGGRERSFDVTSLISWRGEWYVVHLTGFK